MTEDESAIRELIERWARAVHAGDLDTVLADHDSDIVMFDVPPPYDGVRGIDAYRESWPPFFEWQRQGAEFEIVELEVTAGTDVAFAYALLRCGKPAEFEANPDNLLADDGRAAQGRTGAGPLRTSIIRSRLSTNGQALPAQPGLTADAIRRVDPTFRRAGPLC